MSREITMTREGGFYYRAIAWHWLIAALSILPFFLLVALALLNPFWFRQDMFLTLDRWATRIARWRDRIKYRIYLGTDPAVWDALKDKS